MRPRAEYLDASDLDDIVEVISAAFHEYPVMRFVHDPGDDYGERLRAMFRFSCESRFARGRPVLGVRDSGRLAGAALLAWPVPESGSESGDLDDLRAAVRRRLGEAASRRLERYGMTADRLAPACPHYHLAVLAVRPGGQSRGFGRVLLDAVHRLSASDPASTGVALNTETAKNVELYRHVGYRVVGEADLSDGAAVEAGSAERRTLHTWCLFRPDDRT